MKGGVMLYVIHFSFAETSSSAPKGWETSHGFFTVLQEADEPEDAIDKCKLLLRKMHRESDWLRSGAKVFLDTCLEVKQLPAEGLLGFFQEMPGSSCGGISRALPGASEDHAIGYVEDNDAPFLDFTQPQVVAEPAE
jgi:hypothetical protein